MPDYGCRLKLCRNKFAQRGLRQVAFGQGRYRALIFPHCFKIMDKRNQLQVQIDAVGIALAGLDSNFSNQLGEVFRNMVSSL